VPARSRALPRALLALVLTGCSLSPLQNRIAVGEDRFVAFVGDGPDGHADIYAGLPAGGELSRITFTPVDESHPALTPLGDMVAFVRYPPPEATATPSLVVMNLLNGAERAIATIATAGGVDALAWNGDQSALLVRGAGMTWEVPFPEERGEPRRLEGAALAVADSALDVVLGTPAFARAMPCVDGGICVVGPRGAPTVISRTGRQPFRWGSDSLAWFEDDRLMVRPLGPGAPRTITWQEMPAQMRQGSYAWREASPES
jgi:hypothetical protein